MSIFILISYLVTLLLLVVVEGAQGGYQEMHITNGCAMIGQMFATVSLSIAVYYHAVSITSLIICLCIIANIPRLINGLVLVGHRRSHLLPRPRHFNPYLARIICSAGIAFGLIGLGHFIRQECSILVVGRLLGPSSVASYAIVLNIIMTASGVVTMQLSALLPAIIDALVHDDMRWIKLAWCRALSLNMAYAAAFGLAMMIGGAQIIKLLYGPDMVPGTALQIIIGLRFIIQVWEMNHHLILFGLKCIWPPAIAFVLQNLVAFILCLVLTPIYGAAGAAGAFLITSVALDAWFLPYLLRSQLAKHA